MAVTSYCMLFYAAQVPCGVGSKEHDRYALTGGMQESDGIMGKKMETTIIYGGYIGVILGLYWDNVW